MQKKYKDKIQLIGGNCMFVMPNIPDNGVDIVFTSPPYNRKRNDKYENYDDKIDDYFGFLVKAIDEMIRVSSGNVYLNIQKNYYNKIDIFKLFGHYAKEICEVFIWEKSNPMPANGFNITNSYEFIIVFGDKIKSNKTYTKNHITTSVAKMIKKHRAIMHYDIAKFFISNFTQPNQTILDPFMGTGTTGLACKNLERNFIGIESDREYLETARERIFLNKSL